MSIYNIQKKMTLYSAKSPSSLKSSHSYAWHDWATVPRAFCVEAHFYGVLRVTSIGLFKKPGGIKVLNTIHEAATEVPLTDVNPFPDAIDYPVYYPALHTNEFWKKPAKQYGWHDWAAVPRVTNIESFFCGASVLPWKGMFKKPCELKVLTPIKEMTLTEQFNNITDCGQLKELDSHQSGTDNNNNNTALMSNASPPVSKDNVVLEDKNVNIIPDAESQCQPFTASSKSMVVTIGSTVPLDSSSAISTFDSTSESSDSSTTSSDTTSDPDSDSDKSDVIEVLDDVRIPIIPIQSFTIHRNPDGSEAILGEGAYGKVYLGKLAGCQDLVVIKQVNTVKMSYTQVTAEAKIQRLLAASRIAPKVIAIAYSNMGTYIVCEYIANAKPLNVVGKKLSKEDWLDVLQQLVKIVRKMHRLRVIHNDIKRNNILLETDGTKQRVHLIDFGKATFRRGRLVRSLQPEQMRKYPHMAPEMFFGQETTEASDVYSIGRVMMRTNLRDELSPLIARCVCDKPSLRPNIDDLFFSLLNT